MIRRKERKQHTTNRRGIAILEFCMSLPLVLLAFLFILLGARLFVMRVYVAQVPRQQTYPLRHGVPTGQTYTASMNSRAGKIFQRPANGGLISATKTATVPIPKQIGRGTVELSSVDHVLGGSWDHQSFIYHKRSQLQVNRIFSVYDSKGAQGVRTVQRVLARVGL